MLQPMHRRAFLKLAVLCEASLVLAALLVAWLFPIQAEEDPLQRGGSTSLWQSVGWGVAGTGPLFLIFLYFERSTFGPLRRIRQFLFETLGATLCACRWYDLLFVAALAGFCEELLFRGVLQPRLGLVGSNLLFGLLHAVTPTYAILAGLLGGYLGELQRLSGTLGAAMLTHGLYDFLAFEVIAHRCRPASGGPRADSSEAPN